MISWHVVRRGRVRSKVVIMANLVIFDNDMLVRKMNCAIDRAHVTGDEMMIALIHDILRAKKGHIEWRGNHDDIDEIRDVL